MTRLRRVIYAFKFIRTMAKQHPHLFERTKSREVAITYGLRKPNGEPDSGLVRKMKARFRCELSFGEGK